MKKKNKEENLHIDKSILEVFQFQYYDEEVEALVFEGSLYEDILEFQSKDRVNTSDDEIEYDMLLLAKFYKVYSDSIKWISLNFPVNTTVQQKNKDKLAESTVNPVRKKWLERQKRELQLVADNTQKRACYLQIFSKDKSNFIKLREKVLSELGRGREALIKEISKEEKIKVYYKLNNMNSLVRAKEEEDE